jgi:hypothetical protein
LTIQLFDRDEMFMNNADDEDSDVCDDEDDENAEDNWRNDYPDEDPQYYAYDDQGL